jgi:opacity protein-like surface antigen
MKKIVLSVATTLAMSSFVFAGGDIVPIEEPIVEVPEMIEEAPMVNDTGFYLGLGYGALGFDRTITAENHIYDIEYQYDDGLSLDYDTVMFQVGYKINQYVAVEYRYWKGMGDEDVASLDKSLGGVGTADISAYGFYAKPMYPVSDKFNLYALLGYSVATYDVNYGNNMDGSIDKDGFSWGLGAGFAFNQNVSVTLDYVVVADDSYDSLMDVSGKEYGVTNDTTVDTVNVAVSYKF